MEEPREREALLQRALEAAPDAVIIVTVQGRIVFANAQTETLFGYTREGLAGKSLETLLPERFREKHAGHLARYFANPRTRPMGLGLELYARDKDGREFPVDIGLSPLESAGETFVMCVIRNLTERKRGEEALRQSEKLVALSTLVAGVAHELNNPLSILVGQAVLLQEALASGVLAERAGKIAKAAERCARIVKNFLALARQRPPERRRVELNGVVRDTLELVAYQLRVDDVEVEVALAEDLPILWADPHQLQQVVVNLVSNAHQAMRASSPPRRLTVAMCFDPARQLILLTVADTGPGIPPEIRARIFEPFFTTRAPGQGTGLGLSLCKGIIEAHGGSIGVESGAGGALVRVELPVVAPPEVAPEGSVAEATRLIRGKSILVVDDEPEIAAVLAEMLSADDHRVATAANGAIALEMLWVQAYDLILSDVRMPVLDGVGLYRELDRRRPELLRRFAFITGDTLSSETREFLERLGAPSLGKPFLAAEVRSLIQQILASPTA